jgi:hypothetical protein
MTTYTKLVAYNNALLALGQPSLDSLTEASENRYLLDRVYDSGAIDACLEQGNWNFATRTIRSEYDSSVSSPDFGYSRAFSKPSDLIRVVQLASDEFFQNPMTDLEFSDEQSYWWADIDTIYVRYVSNDTSYGGDLSLWTASFSSYFELYLANQIAPRVIQAAASLENIAKREKRAHLDALSKDAMADGVKFAPESGWAGARGGYRRRRDRGSRGSLLG